MAVAKVGARAVVVTKLVVARVVHLLLGHLVDHLVGRHLVGRHQAEVGGKVVVGVALGVEAMVVVVVEKVIPLLVGHSVGYLVEGRRGEPAVTPQVGVRPHQKGRRTPPAAGA